MAKAKANLKPWRPGASGNPGGANADVYEAIGLARQNSPKAMQFIIDRIDDDKTPMAVRVDCAKTIVERVHGRAAQAIHLTRSEDPLDGVPEADRAATLREIAIVALERLAASRAPIIEAKALPVGVETTASKADPEDPDPT